MNIQPSVSLIQNVDRVLDYIPVVSCVSSLFQIFQKCILFTFVSLETINKNRYFQLVNNKPLLRCVVLLVPCLGNLAVAFYDFVKSYQVSNQELKIKLQELTNEMTEVNNDLRAYKDAIQKIQTAIKCDNCKQVTLSPYAKNRREDVLCETCADLFITTERSVEKVSTFCYQKIVKEMLKLESDSKLVIKEKNITWDLGLKFHDYYREQFQLGLRTVPRIMPQITFNDWITGVYLDFEKNVPFVFKETVASLLKDRIVGENVKLHIIPKQSFYAIQGLGRGVTMPLPIVENYPVIFLRNDGSIKIGKTSGKGDKMEFVYN